MQIETLESRKLLSADVSWAGSTLVVKYTDAGDFGTIEEVTLSQAGEPLRTGISIDGGEAIEGARRLNVQLNSSGSGVFFDLQTLSIRVTGGAGDDIIVGNVGNNADVAVDAGGGFNEVTLVGGAVAGRTASITGGSGIDVINVSNFSNIVIDSKAGDDNIYVSGGNIVFVNAGLGDDIIDVSSNGSTVILAGSGVDTITVAGTGNFVVIGGAGSDTLDASGATGTVIPLSI